VYKRQEVYRRPLFGVPGDQPLTVNRDQDWIKLTQQYGPFGYANPDPQPDTVRKYKIYAVYWDENSGGKTNVQIKIANGDDVVFTLPRIAGGWGWKAAHFSTDYYVPETEASRAHAVISARLDSTAPYNNYGVVYAVDLISYDCKVEKVKTMNVFVTSTNYNGNLGGIKGADQKCNLAAANAGLEGTYKAWIATSPLDDPESRFVGADKPYTTVNGDILAKNFDDVRDGSLLQSNYFYDEYGTAIGPDEGGVATPLRENGTYDESRAETCYGYNSASRFVRSNFIARRTDGGLGLNTAVQCNFGKMKLLCVEQGEE